MIWQIDLALFVALIAAALIALWVRNLLTAVAVLAVYSLLAAVLFAGMGAVDVALVEAVLGAGVTGVLFILAVLATTRRTPERAQVRRRWTIMPLLAAFFGLMLYAGTGLPPRGDPEAPVREGVAPQYLERSLEDTETPNVVTALLADYRSQDTLGETLVIVTAALAVALILRRDEEVEL